MTFPRDMSVNCGGFQYTSLVFMLFIKFYIPCYELSLSLFTFYSILHQFCYFVPIYILFCIKILPDILNSDVLVLLISFLFASSSFISSHFLYVVKDCFLLQNVLLLITQRDKYF